MFVALSWLIRNILPGYGQLFGEMQGLYTEGLGH
jgi:hypothetical protein